MQRRAEKKARLLTQRDRLSSENALDARFVHCPEDVVNTGITMNEQNLSERVGSSVGDQAKYAQHEDDPSVSCFQALTPISQPEIKEGSNDLSYPTLCRIGSLIRVESEITNNNMNTVTVTSHSSIHSDPDEASATADTVDNSDSDTADDARALGRDLDFSIRLKARTFLVMGADF